MAKRAFNHLRARGKRREKEEKESRTQRKKVSKRKLSRNGKEREKAKKGREKLDRHSSARAAILTVFIKGNWAVYVPASLRVKITPVIFLPKPK